MMAILLNTAPLRPLVTSATRAFYVNLTPNTVTSDAPARRRRIPSQTTRARADSLAGAAVPRLFGRALSGVIACQSAAQSLEGVYICTLCGPSFRPSSLLFLSTRHGLNRT
jgi:hypothetical protein